MLLLLETIPFFAIQLMLIRTNQAQVELFLFLDMRRRHCGSRRDCGPRASVRL
jgi:hypothetical protein